MVKFYLQILEVLYKLYYNIYDENNYFKDNTFSTYSFYTNILILPSVKSYYFLFQFFKSNKYFFIFKDKSKWI